MRYEVIDKNLKLYCCRISDLTFKQTNEVLKDLDDDSTISELSLFYDPKECVIVLNKDNVNYDLYRIYIHKYMSLTPENRANVMENVKKAGFEAEANTLKVVDDALIDIECNRILFLLQNQKEMDGRYVPDYHVMKCVFAKIKENYHFSNVNFWMYKAVRYGYMLGKRAERARKKVQTEG